MINRELTSYGKQFDEATCPEQVFGKLSGDKMADLASKYRTLLKAVHPDHNAEYEAQANELVPKLNAWRAQARMKIANSTYGDHKKVRYDTVSVPLPRTELMIGKQTLVLNEAFAEGTLSTVRYAEYKDNKDGFLFAKIARHSEDSDLLQREWTTLKALWAPDPIQAREDYYQTYRNYIPKPIQTFNVMGTDGKKHKTNLLATSLGERYTIQQLKERHFKEGVPPEHCWWIFRRILSVLMMVHTKGFVHGALTPDHILVLSDPLHGIMLLDWTNSTKIGETIPTIDDHWKEFIPAEVNAKATARPSMDICTAAATIIYLLGGHASLRLIPHTISVGYGACGLSKLGNLMTHLAYVVIDLGFGDAGKGTVVDSLVRKHGAEFVVRYCGGAQAAHSVQDSDGRYHKFSQFGSGTLVAGTKTFLSEYMLLDPPALYFENERLKKLGIDDAFERLYVDPYAFVVTPYHVNANRITEYLRNAARYGSCGRGIGQTVSDNIQHPEMTLTVGDLRDKDALYEKLRFFRELKQEEMTAAVETISRDSSSPEYILKEVERLYDKEEFDAALEEFYRIGHLFTVTPRGFLKEIVADMGVTVFEGAQGVLLDEKHGFHPNTTWSNTTSANALTLLANTLEESVEIRRLGVTRAYSSRHGAGPFPTEDKRMSMHWKDPHNPENIWQGAFRTGWLDLNLIEYAIDATLGIDELAITCLDQMASMPEELPWKIATGYTINGDAWKLCCDTKRSYQEQAAVGKLLTQVKPVYMTEGPRSMEEYAQYVSQCLSVPLRLSSYGPKSDEKVFHEKLSEKSKSRMSQRSRHTDAKRNPQIHSQQKND